MILSDKMSLENEVLEKIKSIYRDYSNEYRSSTQPYRLDIANESISNYKYDIDDKLVREPLIEHVGSLPVIATIIYPYIQDDSVDLGKALTMLAIHDIGELSVGDENTFLKNSISKDKEGKEAILLLDPYYHDIYKDVETRQTQTAKFAKSVDKIAPDILDLLCPIDITLMRYKKILGNEPSEITDLIMTKKHPYMTWNPFFTKLHLELIHQLDVKIASI